MMDNYNNGSNQRHVDDWRQRAGVYQWQPTGYRAFSPKPLPPIPPLHIDDEMLDLLARANLVLGRLDGASEILPNADLFVAMYVNKEAVLSSQIEGTQASLVDVLAFEAAAAEPENPQDVEEVVNYVAALNYGLSRLTELPFSLRLLREIHARLMSGVRGADKHPGEFRTSQNWIGNPGSTLNGARFVPPSPADMLQALSDLEHFFYAPESMPTLLKIGLIHAQFETIHPFLDGNGRMGRLLITFYLCQQQIIRKPLLYLSHYFKMHKQEYYEHLQYIRDEGAWESWLKFFLAGVLSVAQEATDTARNIVHLRERHRTIIAQALPRGGGTGAQLLDYLYERPITTVKAIGERLHQTYASANTLVAKFIELGILRELTRRERNRRFAYYDYLALFTDELPDSLPPMREASDVTHSQIVQEDEETD
jgi:Fic family protein